MRSRVSSFKWEYPILSLRSSSSYLRLLPRLLVTSISPFIFPSITCFRRQFLRKLWPIQLAFRFLISCRNLEKYCRVTEATDDKTAHAHFMLIPKAANTHSEYVILIAFPLQLWLHERASLLHYTYIAWQVLLQRSRIIQQNTWKGRLGSSLSIVTRLQTRKLNDHSSIHGTSKISFQLWAPGQWLNWLFTLRGKRTGTWIWQFTSIYHWY